MAQLSKENTKVINVPPISEEGFYKLWVTFLTPLHKLTPRNIEIAAELLRHRQRLSKVILDENVLMKVLMNSETRDEITKKCNISTQNYHVAISSLKKAKFFKDGRINPKMIPPTSIEQGECNLLVTFEEKRDE